MRGLEVDGKWGKGKIRGKVEAWGVRVDDGSWKVKS